jgi:polyisoprenoid-binding protein YceI
MRSLPRVLLGGVAAVVVVVVALAAGWWFLVREDNNLATDAPEITDELRTTPVTPGDESGGGQAFRIISERSEAAYFADEQLAALPVPSTAKGSTTAITGEFYLSDDGLDLDTSRESRFTVDLRSIKSDQALRDKRVHEVGLETARFPTATFVVSGITGVDPALAEGAEQTLQLSGMMDLHGVQRELTWEVKARREGGVMTALATVTFQFADFNIPVLNIANFVSAQDDVTLQVQIVAQRL